MRWHYWYSTQQLTKIKHWVTIISISTLQIKHTVFQFVLVRHWACESKFFHCCNNWSTVVTKYLFINLSVMFLPQCILCNGLHMNTLLNSIQLSHALKSTRHKTEFHVALHTQWKDDQNSAAWPCITKLHFPHAQTGDSRYALHILITKRNSRIQNSLFKLR